MLQALESRFAPSFYDDPQGAEDAWSGVGGGGGGELTVKEANRSNRASILAVREAWIVSILVFKVELSWERDLTASSSLSVVT